MSASSFKASDVIEVFSGALVVGNHDSITLFGIQAQNRLKDYSRRVTTMLLKETENLDMAVSDVLTEIQQFELKSKRSSLFGKRFRQKEIQKDCTKIISYIDSMAAYFKLQQAQLIKEIKLLEKMSETISLCSDELEKCIELGKRVLCNRAQDEKVNESTGFVLNTNSDTEAWYKRLEKRIEDLAISHTVSLQNQAQIKVLQENNLIMLDKISSAISNTFPIWQNQMAVMLGIELLETRIKVQDKIVNNNEKSTEETKQKYRYKTIHKSDITVNVEKIHNLNDTLSNALQEMTQLEENYDMLRKNFLDSAHHIERG